MLPSRLFPRAVALAAAAVLLALAAPARAQSTVEAEKLFRDGKALMKKGKIAEACDAFEASQRIESNLATVMSLADCREKNSQLASAWGFFLKAESLTRNDPSKGSANATARKRAALLEPRMSYLTVNVPDESRVEGLVVSRNGVIIDPGTWNRAVPIDGGEYEIEGKAPGHEQWSTRVTIAAEGDKKSVEVPKFKELPKLIEPPVQQQPGITAPLAAPTSIWSTKRKVAIGVAGGAVLALGTGVALGLYSKSLEDDAEKTCPIIGCTDADARDANDKIDRSNTMAIGADVAFGVSLAAAIGAGVLWYLGEPSPMDSELEEEPEAGDISLRPAVGAFTGITLDARF